MYILLFAKRLASRFFFMSFIVITSFINLKGANANEPICFYRYEFSDKRIENFDRFIASKNYLDNQYYMGNLLIRPIASSLSVYFGNICDSDSLLTEIDNRFETIRSIKIDDYIRQQKIEYAESK